MIDILGAVYDFVLAYAKSDDIPAYTEDQIVRGFQNMAAMPSGTHEFCTLTLLETQRHGTDHEWYENAGTSDPDDMKRHLAEVLEHVVQLDFCSAEPFVLPQVTQQRANLIELLSGSSAATDFFESIADPDGNKGLLTCLYAEDVRNLSGWDETKTYTARYMTRLHLQERFEAALPVDYFTEIDIRPMASDGSNLETEGQLHYGESDVVLPHK